ncbi:MAG: type 4a pilus biogenesis protein PilO [Opitutaceae bacterium]|nr:type 4a pilus biogenesis protein PilO [Opitutaceae bacterium]
MNDLLQQIGAFVRRHPVAVVSLTLFVLLGVANYFLWQRQSELTARHERIRLEGEKTLQSLAAHSRTQANLTIANEAIAHLEKNLIVESELPENLSYFYQMETSSRVRLSDLQQLGGRPVDDGGPYRAIPFSLHVTGSYSQVMAFIHALETGPRLLRISAYTFSRRDPVNDALALELTVEVLARP